MGTSVEHPTVTPGYRPCGCTSTRCQLDIFPQRRKVQVHEEFCLLAAGVVGQSAGVVGLAAEVVERTAEVVDRAAGMVDRAAGVVGRPTEVVSQAAKLLR